MNQKMRNDADAITKSSLKAVLPDEAVARALKTYESKGGRTILVAAGKAAWQMAKAAVDVLGSVDAGIVITKYDHVIAPIPGIECCEAGHPVPDENSFAATEKAVSLVSGLTDKDTVLFLLSGGGSALFEMPLIPGEELQDITKQLLASGADIVEMNTIRKRLSGVKGGRFAKRCMPAHVFSIVLSDILGDPLDMIASGPAYPDTSTCEAAAAIVEKYSLKLSEKAQELLKEETPKELTNVTTQITGSVRELCAAAAVKCGELGYKPIILTDQLCSIAREAGSFLASILKTHAGADHPHRPALLDREGSGKLPCQHPEDTCGRCTEREARLHRRRRDRRTADRERPRRPQPGACARGLHRYCRHPECRSILLRQRRHGRTDRCSRRICG